MMVMMVVMVVMRMPFAHFHMATLRMAMLVCIFEFKSGVGDVMLAELLSYHFLYPMTLTVGNYVHGGVIFLSVHAPYVNMMNVNHSVDMQKMLSYLAYINIARRFFEKKL